MRMTPAILLIVFLIFSAPGKLLSQLAKSDLVSCDQDLCRLKETGVALKVLPRPFSTLYEEMNQQSKVLDSTVSAFSPLYVFARKGIDEQDLDSKIGWYQVGRSKDKPLGWMPAADLVEWHNSLILSYTPVGLGDEKRNRVLGFSTLGKLQNIAMAADRTTLASDVLDLLDHRNSGGAVPRIIKEIGVVSAEPINVYRDIKDNFYMWPILTWSQPDEEAEERFVEFLQLVPECRKNSDRTILAHENDNISKYLQGEAIEGKKQVNAADLIFVVDTTSSMGPYIEAVKNGISQAVEFVDKANGSIRFGFVGYQDDHSELDYRSQDFFPDGLVDANTFIDIVSREVKVERWGKHMLPERLFEGFTRAIDGRWRENTIKFIIVITDAPGIPQSDGDIADPQLVTDQYVTLEETDPERFTQLVGVSLADAKRLGRVASDANIQVMTVFIDPGHYAAISEVAGRQLSFLPQNENTSDGFVKLDGSSNIVKGFDLEIRKVVEKITRALGVKTVQDLAHKSTVSDALGVLPVDTLIEAAVMEYLGNAQIVDCDYRAWTTDRDLADHAIRALDVNVMLTHHQFDTLYKTVRDVHRALSAGEITGQSFIDSLKSVGTVVIADPEAIEKAKSGSLASSGVLPRWLVGLPYHSDIAGLSAEDINDMTSADRLQLEVNIGNKLQRYEAVISNNDLWHSLSGHDEGKVENRVTPVPLEDLP